MDISEEVLFSTLTQLLAKEGKTAPQNKGKSKTFEVVKETTSPKVKVDELFELERKIISLLLLYGTVEEEFEDLVWKENTQGELVLEPELQKAKVFEKIYLDLQEDEVAFTNELFKELYGLVIAKLNEEGKLTLETFVNELDSKLSGEVTTILMEEEQYILHDWERMDIMVKQKDASVARLVNETILALRRFLITRKIDELSKEIKEAAPSVDGASSSLEDIVDYLSLKRILSDKLNRVM